MRAHGAVVTARDDPGRAETLRSSGVPVDDGCHFAEVGGYVVVGHVPAEAISKLLADRPDSLGLVVPGMPADSPGMGGDPEGWSALDVFLIGRDGQLAPFDF